MSSAPFARTIQCAAIHGMVLRNASIGDQVKYRLGTSSEVILGMKSSESLAVFGPDSVGDCGCGAKAALRETSTKY